MERLEDLGLLRKAAQSLGGMAMLSGELRKALGRHGQTFAPALAHKAFALVLAKE
jgi:hypothetical protein